MQRFSTSRAALLFVLLPAVTVVLQGCAYGAGGGRRGGVGEAAALAAQAQGWDEAIVRKDRAAIAGNMADDFRQIRGNGDVVDRATFLADITDPRLEIDPYTVEDFSVRLYGDVALLCGRTRMTGRYDGEPFVSHYRYIDVYVRAGSEWRVASVQITRLPD